MCSRTHKSRNSATSCLFVCLLVCCSGQRRKSGTVKREAWAGLSMLRSLSRFWPATSTKANQQTKINGVILVQPWRTNDFFAIANFHLLCGFSRHEHAKHTTACGSSKRSRRRCSRSRCRRQTDRQTVLPAVSLCRTLRDAGTATQQSLILIVYREGKKGHALPHLLCLSVSWLFSPPLCEEFSGYLS